MNGTETDMGEWRSLGGAPVSGGEGDADVVFAHVSDLHGQLTPRYQVYYDNPTSGPAFDFGEDDRLIKRAGGIPLLAAKLDALRGTHDVCTLMSGDTFHGSAVTTYTDGRAMLDPVNEHVFPDIYVPGNWDYSTEATEDGNFLELMDELDLLGLDREAFVERLTGDPPEKSTNYETVIAINTGKETVDDESEATALELGPNNCAA